MGFAFNGGIAKVKIIVQIEFVCDDVTVEQVHNYATGNHDKNSSSERTVIASKLTWEVNNLSRTLKALPHVSQTHSLV